MDFLLISVIKAFQQFLRLLPEGVCRTVGIIFGRLGYLVLSDRRRVAIANAGRIAPRVPRSEAKAIARRCFENLGVNFIESLLFPYLQKRAYGERFRQVGGEYVEQALKGGRLPLFKLGDKWCHLLSPEPRDRGPRAAPEEEPRFEWSPHQASGCHRPHHYS